MVKLSNTDTQSTHNTNTKKFIYFSIARSNVINLGCLGLWETFLFDIIRAERKCSFSPGDTFSFGNSSGDEIAEVVDAT